MKITIKTNSQSKQLELDPDTLIEDLKALIEAELGNPYPQQILKYKGIQLSDNKQLKSYNIKDGDIIYVERLIFY